MEDWLVRNLQTWLARNPDYEFRRMHRSSIESRFWVVIDVEAPLTWEKVMKSLEKSPEVFSNRRSRWLGRDWIHYAAGAEHIPWHFGDRFDVLMGPMGPCSFIKSVWEHRPKLTVISSPSKSRWTD